MKTDPAALTQAERSLVAALVSAVLKDLSEEEERLKNGEAGARWQSRPADRMR